MKHRHHHIGAATGIATGGVSDPAALTLQPGWGPPPPGTAYPHGSGYLDTMPGYVPITTTLSWVMALTDGLYQVNSASSLSGLSPEVKMLTKKPARGSVILTFTHTLNEYAFQCLIHDGTKWVDDSPVTSPGMHSFGFMMSKGTPGDMTVNAFCNGPTAIADAKAALFGGGQLAAAAQADGVHLFTKTTDGTINENLNSYPPGVTLADMPVTQVWVTPPPVVVKPVIAAATTPNAKAWVGTVTDTIRIPTGPGTFDTPLPTSPAPVKGCVYLACVDDSLGNLNVNAYIHDGTNWQPTAPVGFSVPEKAPGVAPDAPQIKAYYFGNANAASNWGWDQGDEMTASAEPDGIHLFTEDETNTVNENTVPYPAGVTMADMPATKTF